MNASLFQFHEERESKLKWLGEDVGLTAAFKEELYGEFSCTIT